MNAPSQTLRGPLRHSITQPGISAAPARSGRNDESQLRKVGAEVAAVAGYQAVGVHQRMCANEEVGNHMLPPDNGVAARLTSWRRLVSALLTLDLCSSTSAIAQPCLAGPPQRPGREPYRFDPHFGQELLQFCRPLKGCP